MTKQFIQDSDWPPTSSTSGPKLTALPSGQLELTNDGKISFDESDWRIRLGGHNIDYSDDFMTFECTVCEEKISVPEIFKASTPSNKIVYQLYILSQFKKSECTEPEQSAPPNVTKTPPVNSGNIYWSDSSTNNIMTVRTDTGSIITDGTQVIKSTDADYSSGQRLTEKELYELTDRKI